MIWQIELLILVIVIILAVGALSGQRFTGRGHPVRGLQFYDVPVVGHHGRRGCGFYRSFGRSWCQYGAVRGRRVPDVKEDRRLRIPALIFVIITGGVLIYGSLEFPSWGDPDSPACCHVSPYYIEKSVEDTSVPNMVTAVLADYRGYDTMFETIVIFTAGIACIFLLRIFQKEEKQTRLYRHIPTGITLRIEKGGKFPDQSLEFERIDTVWVPHDLIVKTTCRLIVPFIQIFGLYVIAHGHHSPGGGFQGGVILGAAMIFYAVAFNLRESIRRAGEH